MSPYKSTGCSTFFSRSMGHILNVWLFDSCSVFFLDRYDRLKLSGSFLKCLVSWLSRWRFIMSPDRFRCFFFILAPLLNGLCKILTCMLVHSMRPFVNIRDSVPELCYYTECREIHSLLMSRLCYPLIHVTVWRGTNGAGNFYSEVNN